jgi:hypothetical protein
MTPETVQAIGQYIVMPIMGAIAFVAYIYFLWKD